MADLPKIAAGTADKGTPEEYKAILSSLVASYGTYTVNEDEKMLITRVEGGAYPNLIGVDQKRVIISLTPDERPVSARINSVYDRAIKSGKPHVGSAFHR